MSIVALAITEAVEGMLFGWVFGAIEEFSKFLFVMLFAAGVAITLGIVMFTEPSQVAEPFTPLWSYGVFVAFFIGGRVAGKAMVGEALQ